MKSINQYANWLGRVCVRFVNGFKYIVEETKINKT